jgi:hypothetical protein
MPLEDVAGRCRRKMSPEDVVGRSGFVQLLKFAGQPCDLFGVVAFVLDQQRVPLA